MSSIEGHTQYTEADIIRAIEADENMHVIPQDPYTFPTAFDLQGFESSVYPRQNANIAKGVSFVIDACRNYLTGVVVTDTFTNHWDRRDWRQEMFAKFGKPFENFYNRNKLRQQNMRALQTALVALTFGCRVYKIDTPEAMMLKKITEEFPDTETYDTMSIPEKLNFVKQIEQVCEQFLALIEKK